jgi:hypothetical protein
MRRLRDRRRSGIRVLPVEVSIDTVEILVELGYIDREQAQDVHQVREALARFIEDTAQAVTRNKTTLDVW